MLAPIRSFIRRSRHVQAARRLRRDEGGNFTIMFGLSAVLLTVFVGMGVDYLTGLSFKSRWDTSADAAALAAIQAAESYIAANSASQSGTTLTNGAIAAGKAQGYKSFASNAAASAFTQSVTPTVTLTIQGNAYIANVSYAGTVKAYFGPLVGISTLTVSGAASATAGLSSPNVDFYVLLDNSPSMALPASTAGIVSLSALTTDSCAFACHENNPASANISSNPIVNGQHIDNYQVAQNNSIKLRIDEVNSGTTTLMATANDYSQARPGAAPTYRFAVDSLDSTYSVGFTNVMPLTNNYISAWKSASSNFQLMQMYDENQHCAATTSQGVTNPCGAASASPNGNADADTNYDDALSQVNAQMPNPGQGTNAVGDSPQEILFFVTDGVEDEVSGSTRVIQEINANGAHDYCTDIKSRGIKIAILYTSYYPLPSIDTFYTQHVEPFQPDIAPALQACASPGLFYQASLDDNLSTDLANLFVTAMSQTAARLTQ